MTHRQLTTVSTLIFCILIDALGWGIVFPVFTKMIINNNIQLFSPNMSVMLSGVLVPSICRLAVG